ncbi:peptidoglycan-binding protein [Streptomyces sp. GESEQ-4]|uniref:peptidoglycan-binding domain-containing protein n=1 Tax=Streptomyces sp. GESEQ-4 TaxID=2812655 RepID=UPI001B319DD0|nr:peptidoglycan-binding domain-containing protein [Streptomyces sp. GESEQ-4]
MSASPSTPTRRIARGAASLLVAGAIAAGASMATAPSASAAIIPNRCTHTSNEPTLSYDPDTYKRAVKQVQCELNYSLRNTTLTVDGYFGSATRSAVRKLQDCSDITIDGIVGPNTWGKLNFWARSTSWADVSGNC